MKIFDELQSFRTGVALFVPEDAQAYEAGAACKGFGIIRYAEGSVYYGDVWFDGTDYNKLGFGRQDFMLSVLGALDPEHKIRRAFYIGQYDYRQTDWICGDGVMYYVDEDNKPACFVPGYYEGVNLVGPYQGTLDESMLPDGYTMDMLSDFDPWSSMFQRQLRALPTLKTLENLFIGDSYFELWNDPKRAGRTFYELFENSLNLGVGGTCFDSWLRFTDAVTALPQPKRIILNLGFNDLHRHGDPERAFEDYKNLLAILKHAFPEAQYYLLNVVRSPAFCDKADIEERLNAMTAASAEQLGVTVIDMRSAIEAAGGTEKAFDPDLVHLNPTGYQALHHRLSSIVTSD